MSTQTGIYFLGTYGFPINILMGANLADATAVFIDLTKPSDVLVTRDIGVGAIVDTAGGVVRYIPLQTEVDEAGVYTFELRVEFAGRQLVSDGQFEILLGAEAPDDLVVEDGSIVEGANSYQTLDGAKAYFAGHLYPEPFVSASKDQQQRALKQARRLMDQMVDYYGYMVDTEQELPWPRKYVPKEQGMAGNGVRDPLYGMGLTTTYYLTYYYPADSIPTGIKEAQCELARELMKTDRTAEADTKGIKSVNVGQTAVEVEFDASDRPTVLPENVQNMLSEFGSVKDTSTNARYVAVHRV